MKKALARTLFGALAAMTALSMTAMAAVATTSADAKALAEKHVPAGSTYISTKDDDGRFEVKFYHEANGEKYEIDVSKATGKIVSFDSESLAGRGSASVTLTEAQAKQVITGEFAKAEILTVKLDRDDGYWEYEITFKTSDYYGEYKLNAETGKILDRDIRVGVMPGKVDTENLIGYAEVEKLALAQVPGGVITDLDLDREYGVYLYEVEVYKDGYEYELAFDASNGALLWNSSHRDAWDWDDGPEPGRASSSSASSASGSSRVSSSSGSSRSSSQSSGQYIGEAKAKEIALGKAPGATVWECKLDWEDGRMVYELELRNGRWEYDFEIDAVTGVILEWDQDYDD